jgi:hypothetical protein
MRASWPNCNGRFHEQARLKPRPLALPFGGGPVGSKPANVSDRRVGRGCLPGLQSGFPSIRTVMADAGYESRKLAGRAKTASRVATAHHQTPAARLQGGGPDLDRGAHLCVALAEIVA